jgi:hypothetical protein
MCIASVFIVAILFLYFLFWFLLGHGEIFGSDRGHVFLVGNTYPDIVSCFKIGEADRYRPLAIFVEGVLTSVATSKGLPGWYFLVVLNGLLLGFATYLFYRIALKVTHSNAAAILASVLMLFSNATIAVPWTVLFSVFYIAPILLLYGMLYGYLMYKDSHRLIWLLPVVIGGVLGPWFREIGVLGAMVIFGVEAVAFLQKPNKFIIIPFLLLLHGLFSTAIPSFLHLYPGGIRYVFHGPEIKANFPASVINWWRTGRTLNEISPILWPAVVAGAGFFLYQLLSRTNNISKLHEFLLCGYQGGNVPEPTDKRRSLAAFAVKVFVIFSIISLSVMFINTSSPEASRPKFRPEVLLILFTGILSIISAFRIGMLVVLWFFVQLLILIKQPHNFEAHLVFIVPALCIIVSVWVVDIWNILTEYKKRWGLGFLRIAAGVIIIFGSLNQVQNLYVGFRVIRNIICGTQEIANWFNANVVPRSVIFVNSFPAFEILHRAGWKYDVRWITIAGPITHHPDYRSITDYKMQLEYIQKAYDQGRNVYYLIVTSKNFSGPYSMPGSGLENLKLWTIRLPQTTLDPLRYFIQKPRYMQVFAPFQWRETVEEFDSKKDALGWNIELSLSKLKTENIPAVIANAKPNTTMTEESILHIPETLIIDGYKDTNYNIIYSHGKYYGLYRGEGPFVIEKVEKGQYKTPVFIGNSQEEIKQLLDEAQISGKLKLVANTKSNASAVSPAEDFPKLVVDGYKNTNYNIIYYHGKYYGLFRGEGAFAVEKIEKKEYKTPVFIADSLEHLKEILDEKTK